MNKYGYQPVDMGQQYQQQLPPEQPFQENYKYDKDYDQIENYGSIIKDLTDTADLLKDYELRLLGLKIDEEGNEISNPNIKPLIHNRQTASNFVDMIRSIANQNTHFTGFEEVDINNSLNALNYTINRWMMFQGENIPLRHRQKLSFEAMNIAKASLHKAKKALMAKWSKGQIHEGQNITQGPKKKGILDYVFPGSRNK